MVDTEPCSSASRLPGIDFAKVTPEIICETGPDFINDPKKTKHVRISFQWPGGLEYRNMNGAARSEKRRIRKKRCCTAARNGANLIFVLLGR